MTDALTKAAQAALIVLEGAAMSTTSVEGIAEAASDLRAALAAQQVEPTLRDQHKAFADWWLGLHSSILQEPLENIAWAAWKIAAAQPQQAEPCDEEIGWLIEHRAAEHTLWWSGEFCPADGEYRSARLIARMSNDANNAVRFARKEDAQRVLDAMLAARPSPILARAPELYSVTEHMWTAAAQPQQITKEKV